MKTKILSLITILLSFILSSCGEVVIPVGGGGNRAPMAYQGNQMRRPMSPPPMPGYGYGQQPRQSQSRPGYYPSQGQPFIAPPSNIPLTRYGNGPQSYSRLPRPGERPWDVYHY